VGLWTQVGVFWVFFKVREGWGLGVFRTVQKLGFFGGV